MAVDRYCPECSRVYSPDDWQEDTCPFCENDVPLKNVSDGDLLEDTLTKDIPWPKGERETVLCNASGYVEAQLIKMDLEAAGIPVLINAGANLGLTVPVMVPKSRLDEAREIVFK
jgi:hypothetical protein